MIVTDKKYYIDDALLKRLDLIVKRIKGTDDAILVIDGDEGQGKTELAFGLCYYIAYQTKRRYAVDNIFFDLDEVIQFAASTKEQIIHYDEAALGLLRTQWQKKSQQKFLQLAMIARKKKHLIVLCIPKFHRLPPYLPEDRAIGMLHVYSHKNMNKGRYTYYKKDSFQKLYIDYQKKKLKNYKLHYTFRGRFIEASKKVFTPKQMQDYEDKKDQAILNFGGKDEMSNQQKKWIMQRNVLLKALKDSLQLNNTKLSQYLAEKYNLEMPRTTIKEVFEKRSLAATRPL